jgi:CDP-paratose 2-epimerase
VGSESVRFFVTKFDLVVGIDNDMRSYFFGEEASTESSVAELKMIPNYVHVDADIRDIDEIEKVFLDTMGYAEIEMVIHTAAQPSHDWAARNPILDFEVNAMGTLNLLELTRRYAPKATFVFTSTNKVYGDSPNRLPLIEEEKRYEHYVSHQKQYVKGCIDEKMSIDQSKHSVFGASKVAADVMVQEYGKYFGMNTVCFRGGCLTGPNHQGAELHGFLSYLVKCMVHNKPYTIFGYKGKQVRDNIHSSDLVAMFWEYHQNPHPGEVYNAGGGPENNVSILEAIDMVNSIILQMDPSRLLWENYTVSDTAREGDHMWYVSDLRKFKTHYPKWKGITIGVREILKQITEKEMETQ